MHQPLVSVIVACYNAADTLDACLESLMAQTYSALEIIVCDDRSTDDSYARLLAWAEKDSRIRVLRNDANRKSGYTRNRCIEAATGKYCMIQDIDDLCHPQRVERLMDVLESEPGLSFVGSGMTLFDKDGKEFPLPFRPADKPYPTKWDFVWNMPYAHATCMFRREALSSVMYRTSPMVERQEDYDMMMRLVAKGHQGKNIPDKLYLYRYDVDNVHRITTQTSTNYARVRWEGFKALGLMPWAFPFVLKPYAAALYHRLLLMMHRPGKSEK